MSKLIQVPGTSQFVNPDFVTNVFLIRPSGKYRTELFVIGNEGYTTKRIATKADILDVVKAINQR